MQPYRCQIDYHIVWGYYHYVMFDKKKTYFHRKRVLEIMEENPIDIIEYPGDWIYNARMLLIALGHFKMYDEFEI